MLRRLEVFARGPVDRLGPAAAVTVGALALLAAALVPLGVWRPELVLPLGVVLAAMAWRLVGRLRTGAGVADVPLGRGTLLLIAAVTGWWAVLHSGHVVIRRDGGAYALYTQWIATRHGLPVDAGLEAFGGGAAFDVTRFTLSSPAFYQVLDGPPGPDVAAEIVPQFLVGAPAVYSLGWWAGAPVGASWTGMQVVPAVLGGLALLCFAALAARLLGPRWAPLAVAGLGLAMPVVLVARTTYSEPAALLMLLAAAVVAVDAAGVEARGGTVRGLAVLAGALVGLAGLVRVDAVRETALVVAVCAVLAARRTRVAVPMATAALVGSAVSLAIGWAMSRPYLAAIGPSLRPLLLATALVVAASAVVVPLVRWRSGAVSGGAVSGGADPIGTDPWARLATGAVLLLGVGLVSRPLWLTVRQDPADPGARFVALLQRSQQLPIDGGRTYAEHSVDWVAWYLGWPAVVGAWVVLAVLAGRAVFWWRSGTAQPPPWLLPAVVGFCSTVLVVVRPGITPDHPWAARRLVPVLLPLIVFAAVAGIAWASAHLPGRRTWLTQRRVAVVAPALLLVPVLWASAPIALRRTEAGEVDAVHQVCATLQPGDVVATVDAHPDGIAERSGNEWVQVVRGICGRPASALLTHPDELPQAAAELADLVADAGGRLVLLTAQEDGEQAMEVLGAAGADGTSGRFVAPQRAVRMETREDRKWLARRPTGVARLVIDVWLAPASG